jgi:NAD(P)-dependent dehydrogenase (short-subunit alcohol dehydrogenase family)
VLFCKKPSVLNILTLASNFRIGQPNLLDIEITIHTPVLLLIGAGPNIGAAVAKKFADNGCKVALAARSLSSGIQENGYLHVKADLSNPESVPQIFRSVRENHGIPNIVVYNGPYPVLTSIISHTSNHSF